MMENEKLDDLDLPEKCDPKARSGTDYEIVDCLAEYPICSFALHFGYGLLCRHPQRKEIIQKNNAMKKLKDQQD